MAPVEDLPAAIQWHEGMLLAPQHFQQAAARHDAQLHYHCRRVAPFHWGVRRFSVDANLLIDGTFRVEELEAVLPDGLVVCHSAKDETELSIDLLPHLGDQEISTVYLALPAQRSGASPVRGELARFDSVEGELVTDENTGEGKLRIPRLVPRIRLLVTEELPHKYVGFPLARLTSVNETIVRTDYVPPMLEVAVKSPLGELCRSVARSLREKATFLSEQASSPSVAAQAPQLLAQKSALHSLVASLPAFEAVLSTGVSHPFPLYLALCSLVGHVAGLGKGLMPPVLRPYDHNDPRAAFEQARRFIVQTLSEGIVEAYGRFPFQREDGAFLLRFDPEWRNRSLILGVRCHDGVTEESAAQWVERCLIGSKPRMPSMLERRIRGAPRKRSAAETDLVPSRGVTLYALDADPEFIIPGEELEIRNLDDRKGRQQPTEIVLWVQNEISGAEE